MICHWLTALTYIEAECLFMPFSYFPKAIISNLTEDVKIYKRPIPLLQIAQLSVKN